VAQLLLPVALLTLACCASPAFSQLSAPSCPARPEVGAAVPEPLELRSRHGVLRVDLSFRTSPGPQGAREYCYVSPQGREAPTLRVQPGDLLVLRLHNEEPPDGAALQHPAHAASSGPAQPSGRRMSHAGRKRCTPNAMGKGTTNVHFHGLAIPSVCHQDDVLDTLIEPGSAAFEYRFRNRFAWTRDSPRSPVTRITITRPSSRRQITG
jgi:FtsP/CotA-like multicopper oxidase with cupredoxin domain